MNAQKFLSDREAQRLIMALARTRGDRGFTEADAQKLVEWATNARLDATMLDMVLAGVVRVDLRDDGKVIFAADRGGMVA